MKIVIDTSVIIAVIANEPQRESLLQVTLGAELLAPQSVHWEVGNAFSAMMKRNKITIKEARKALSVYGVIPIRFVDIELSESLEISDKLKIYAYDAYLLSCSLKTHSPLLTLDDGLKSAAKTLNIKLAGGVL
ncbi:MAG TPA: VapC toxin family PIN domain ribonuclease [Lentisphaeria bacterium]|nr:MAG: twitching motility protein PilT [Lentisphaerae bacterium GWF2_49_21]HBC88662.1 VapC toxin family PIN domain ribonuclease [Lentisphaeria bacterium]